MFWIPLAIGAGLGALKGNKNVKKQAENDKYRKAAITYSPWTKMGDPGSTDLPGVLESGISGAAMGALAGNALGGGAATAPASVETGVGASGQNALGGVNMSNKLGAQFGGAQEFVPQQGLNLTGGMSSSEQLGAQFAQQPDQLQMPMAFGSPGSLQMGQQNPMMITRYSGMKY
jgi:hypothetical protein